MSLRRYALTKSQAEVVVIALNEVLRITDATDPSGISPYGNWVRKNAQDLLDKLNNYTWEVKK